MKIPISKSAKHFLFGSILILIFIVSAYLLVELVQGGWLVTNIATNLLLLLTPLWIVGSFYIIGSVFGWVARNK